jgi:outer membrane immunogenic protein
MKSVILIAGLMVSAASAANSADFSLYDKRSASSWAGFYFGGSIGGGVAGEYEGRASYGGVSVKDSVNASGLIAGGQIGYQVEMSRVVFGVEGDFSYAGIDGEYSVSTTGVGTASLKAETNWLATVRGRVGYAADKFLFY